MTFIYDIHLSLAALKLELKAEKSDLARVDAPQHGC